MALKKVTLKNGTVVYLKQDITSFDTLSFSKDEITFKQMRVGGADMQDFLDEIQSGSGEKCSQEEWDQSCELYSKLNT